MAMFTPAAADRMVMIVVMLPAPMMMIVIASVGRCYRTQRADCKRECKQNFFHELFQ